MFATLNEAQRYLDLPFQRTHALINFCTDFATQQLAVLEPDRLTHSLGNVVPTVGPLEASVVPKRAHSVPQLL